MKIEIEIDASEVQDELQKKIKAYAVNHIAEWQFERALKERVKEEAKSIADKIVMEVLQDLPAMREIVKSELESTLKRRLAAIAKKGESLI